MKTQHFVRPWVMAVAVLSSPNLGQSQSPQTPTKIIGTYSTEDPTSGGLLELHRDKTFFGRKTRTDLLGTHTEEYAGTYAIDGGQVTFMSPSGLASRATLDEGRQLRDEDGVVWLKLLALDEEGTDAKAIKRYLTIQVHAEERYHLKHNAYTSVNTDFMQDSAWQKEMSTFRTAVQFAATASNRLGVILQTVITPTSHETRRTICRVYFGTEVPLVSGIVAGQPVCLAGLKQAARSNPEDSIVAALGIKPSSPEARILRTMQKDLMNGLYVNEMRFHGRTHNWTDVIGPDGLNLTLSPGNAVSIDLSNGRYGAGLTATITNPNTEHFCVVYMNAEPQPPAQTTNQVACAGGRADSIQAARRARIVAESLRVVQARLDSVQRAQAESIQEERQRPKVLSLADGSSLRIRSHEYQAYAFTIDGTGNCRVEGNVVGLRGGQRDVEVYVFTDEDFLKWTRHLSFESPDFGLYRGARRSEGSVNVPLPGAGTYHVVISNAFSVINAKIVQAYATVTCTGGSAPLPSQ